MDAGTSTYRRTSAGAVLLSVVGTEPFAAPSGGGYQSMCPDGNVRGAADFSVDDAGVDRLLSRGNSAVLASLSDTQSLEVRKLLHLAVRQPGPKFVDLRFTIPLPLLPLYFVLLIGRDRRTASRSRGVPAASRLGNALAALYLVLTLAMTVGAFISLGCGTEAGDAVQSLATVGNNAPPETTGGSQSDAGAGGLTDAFGVAAAHDDDFPADDAADASDDDAVLDDTGDSAGDTGNGSDDSPDSNDGSTGDTPPVDDPPPDGSDPGNNDGSDLPQGTADDNTNGQPPDDPPPDDPPPPPPPPPMPPAVLTFVGYTPDGGELASDGWAPGSTQNRALIIDALPKLATYGFGRYATPCYQGVARSDSDSAAYFAPVLAVSQPNNIRFVPGMWFHHLVQNVWGLAREAPWNVTQTPAVNYHPMILQALLDQAFWDEFVNRTRIIAHGAQSNQVYFDSEETFWKRRYSTFWTPANLATIKPMLRASVAQLRSEGIFVVFYHPYLSPWVPELRAIASGLFRPDDANDPLAFVEHFATDPYYYQATWTPAEPPFIDNYYNTRGFFAVQQVRFGFISSHAAYPNPGLYGFTPQQFHDYMLARPGVDTRCWYVSNNTMLPNHADAFEAIAISGSAP